MIRERFANYYRKPQIKVEGDIAFDNIDNIDHAISQEPLAKLTGYSIRFSDHGFMINIS